jgi:ATP-dependent Clp protease adaptor protein ClpS
MPLPTNIPAAPVVAPELEIETRDRLAPMYRVLIHNDDVTPMDFVVHILKSVFAKGTIDAVRVMWEAHTSGVALVEVAPLERAEFHVEQAHSLARAKPYPLTFSLEPEEV